MTIKLEFNDAEYKNIVDSLYKIETIDRSRALFNGMSNAGDVVKRKAHGKIAPPPGSAGDIIGDLPLRDAIKRRTIEWQSGPAAMTTVVTYDYQTTAQHGHLVEAGHVITPHKGKPKRGLKQRVPGRNPDWQTGLPMGASTVAKNYIQNAATETWETGDQQRAIERSLQYILHNQGNAK